MGLLRLAGEGRAGGRVAEPRGQVMAARGARRARVAFLVPVRNAATTLRSSFASLLAQSSPDFRVLAIDDGSDDETPRILEAIAASDPRVEVHRRGPGGNIGAALAHAATLTDAPLLGRFDADDLAHPERLARQLALLDAQPEVDLVATGIRRFVTDEDGEALLSGQAIEVEATDGWRRYEAWLDACRTPEEIARGLWIESPLPHPSILMRQETYERAGGYRPTAWPEDYDLWLRMLRTGARFAKLPEPLHYWRDLPDRASRTDAAYRAESFLACRVHHLARVLGEREIVVWGAGRDGRRAARGLIAEGARVVAFLDIDPRKIGRRAYGRPIFDAEAWLVGGVNARGPIVLAAVGTAGARELIRARLEQAGWAEGTDFLAIA